MKSEQKWRELAAPMMVFGSVAAVVIREFVQMDTQVRGAYMEGGLATLLLILGWGYHSHLNNRIMGWTSRKDRNNPRDSGRDQGGDGGGAASNREE